MSMLVWMVQLVSGISVPTGKLGPITPARPTVPTANPLAPGAPAPVVEYSQAHPEPPPLDPSYVAPTFNYFDTLAKHHVYYVPVRYRNFNAASNNIDYEPPQKYFGQTLGKNIGYKAYKQQLAAPYTPSWNNQYNNQNNNQYNGQYNNQYNGQYNSQYNNQYSSQFVNQNSQYNVQPAQQQKQQYEAVSTQAAPASTGAPQASSTPVQPQPQPDYRKVDYTTGKGSYDVTGKGGSKSEYYSVSKEDWSKKSIYPKKVLGQALTSRKYASHKY